MDIATCKQQFPRSCLKMFIYRERKIINKVKTIPQIINSEWLINIIIVGISFLHAFEKITFPC